MREAVGLTGVRLDQLRLNGALTNDKEGRNSGFNGSKIGGEYQNASRDSYQLNGSDAGDSKVRGRDATAFCTAHVKHVCCHHCTCIGRQSEIGRDAFVC